MRRFHSIRNFQGLSVCASIALALWALAAGWPARAQTGGDAAPAIETMDAEPRGLPVVELFSARSCMFCPAAEKQLGELVRKGQVFGLTCLVDYFQPGSAQGPTELCTKRQEDYAMILKAGPLYTPQMIVNGAADVIGYREADIDRLLGAPGMPLPAAILVREGGEEGGLNLDLPDLSHRESAPRNLALESIFYRREVHESSGIQDRSFTNFVTGAANLGTWNGARETRHVSWAQGEADIPSDKGGVLILAVDPERRTIRAAGKLEALLPENRP